MKKIYVGIGVFVIVLIGVFFLRGMPETSSYDSNQEVIDSQSEEVLAVEEVVDISPVVSTPEVEAPVVEIPVDDGKISLSELAVHNNENDCWVVYDSKVYDITSYIPRHPGGESRIARNCGDETTFETEFRKQHGTSKVSLMMKVGTFIGDFDIIGDLN